MTQQVYLRTRWVSRCIRLITIDELVVVLATRQINHDLLSLELYTLDGSDIIITRAIYTPLQFITECLVYLR